MQATPQKLPMHLELSQIFDFTPEDLAANREGNLTVAQINKTHVLPYLAYPGLEHMILPTILVWLYWECFRATCMPNYVFHYVDFGTAFIIILLIEVGIVIYFQVRGKVHLDSSMKVVKKIEGKPLVTSDRLQISSNTFALSSGQQMEMRAFVRDADPNANYRVYFIKIHRKMQPILVSLEVVN